MKLPNCYIKVGKFGPLSESVQRLLFSKGAVWVGEKPDTLWQNYQEHLCLLDSTIFHSADTTNKYPHFDAATEFGKLIEFLSEPELPAILVGTYTAEFRTDGVQIGCQFVPTATVKEVYERLTNTK